MVLKRNFRTSWKKSTCFSIIYLVFKCFFLYNQGTCYIERCTISVKSSQFQKSIIQISIINATISCQHFCSLLYVNCIHYVMYLSFLHVIHIYKSFFPAKKFHFGIYDLYGGSKLLKRNALLFILFSSMFKSFIPQYS